MRGGGGGNNPHLKLCKHCQRKVDYLNTKNNSCQTDFKNENKSFKLKHKHNQIKNSNFSFKQENSNAQEEKANCSKLFNCKELNHFKNNSSKNEIQKEQQ